MGKFEKMQTANLATLFETIFYIVLFYYLFKLAVRIFFPVLVKSVVRKAGENFREQYQQQQAQRAPEAPKNQKPRETKIVGEYIDYEEIE